MSISGKVQTKNGTPLTDARVELFPVPTERSETCAHLCDHVAGWYVSCKCSWAGDYIYGVSLGIQLFQGRMQPPYWQRGRTLPLRVESRRLAWCLNWKAGEFFRVYCRTKAAEAWRKETSP